MYNIFICDDDDEFIKDIDKKIKCIILKNNLLKNRALINVHSYTSAKNMIFDLQGQNLSTAIFFMDIVMPNISGIDAAKIIRKMGIDAQIIFVTKSKNHVFEALDLMPMHYLIKKDLSDSKLEEVLLKALRLCYKKSSNFFCYKIGHTIKRISVDKIIFFEVKNRVIMMYKEDGEFDEFYTTMKNLEKIFISKNFVRVHRSYLVNLDYINALEKKNIILKSKAILPIGEKYSDYVEEKYEEFTANDIIL